MDYGVTLISRQSSNSEPATCLSYPPYPSPHDFTTTALPSAPPHPLVLALLAANLPLLPVKVHPIFGYLLMYCLRRALRILPSQRQDDDQGIETIGCRLRNGKQHACELCRLTKQNCDHRVPPCGRCEAKAFRISVTITRRL